MVSQQEPNRAVCQRHRYGYHRVLVCAVVIKLLPSRTSRSADRAAKTESSQPTAGVDDESGFDDEIRRAEAAAIAAASALASAQARVDLLRERSAPATSGGAASEDLEPPESSESSPDGDPKIGSDTGGDETPTRHRRRWLAVATGATAIAVFAAMGAACGVMVWRHHEISRENESTAEFISAARQGVVTLMSMNYQTVDKDIQRIIDNSTGGFRDDFVQRKKDFAGVVEQSKVSTTAKVNAAALQAKSADSATVLITATSEITNSQGARQDPRNWRLIVTVKRDGGQMKMSQVEFVP